jgi:hypothetical protein
LNKPEVVVSAELTHRGFPFLAKNGYNIIAQTCEAEAGAMMIVVRRGDILDSTGWTASAWQSESTFHQLSPYIGKTKSSMAAPLVAQYTKRGDLVCDPFAGCGTFAFEAWVAGRHVIANDLSPYATLLTRAKLFPYRTIDDAHQDYQTLVSLVNLRLQQAKRAGLENLDSRISGFSA